MDASPPETLWQRVRLHPEDNDALRILGDWLNERDELLGALIANAFCPGPGAREREVVLQRRLRDTLFAGCEARVGLTFDRGLPRGLTLLALPGSRGLAERLDQVLAHPALAFLEALYLWNWPDRDLRRAVTSLACTGPHMALHTLVLQSVNGQGDALFHRLWPAVPRLRWVAGDPDFVAVAVARGAAEVAAPIAAPSSLPPQPIEREEDEWHHETCTCPDCELEYLENAETIEVEDTYAATLEALYQRGDITWTEFEASLPTDEDGEAIAWAH
ncbi:MAG: hypothetical protein AAGA48_15710 [Myxococcota bacterium]